jgi:SAM-dependent methyltransferase
LDIGAGVGSFALELQEANKQVTALDISAICCHIMRQRGLEQVIEDNIWKISNQKYDTLLLIMNGVGLAGSLENLPLFIQKLKSLLNPGGHIICDSSDISYLYEEKPSDRYYGEIKYCYEYEGMKGEWFDWLYIDKETFAQICINEGMALEVLHENKMDQYLAKISISA